MYAHMPTCYAQRTSTIIMRSMGPRARSASCGYSLSSAGSSSSSRSPALPPSPQSPLFTPSCAPSLLPLPAPCSLSSPLSIIVRSCSTSLSSFSVLRPWYSLSYTCTRWAFFASSRFTLSCSAYNCRSASSISSAVSFTQPTYRPPFTYILSISALTTYSTVCCILVGKSFYSLNSLP